MQRLGQIKILQSAVTLNWLKRIWSDSETAQKVSSSIFLYNTDNTDRQNDTYPFSSKKSKLLIHSIILYVKAVKPKANIKEINIMCLHCE